MFIFVYTSNMSTTKSLLKCCLYFTSNSLAREVERIADEEFKITGIFPSHAFLVMLVYENPGIGPKELSEDLRLAPSTVTRLTDSLIKKELVKKRSSGKLMKLNLTKKGAELYPVIKKAWNNLYDRLMDILGKKNSAELSETLYKTGLKLKR
jgi:MarR family transcriptional regulator, organic hydroperoxide resistance regulator